MPIVNSYASDQFRFDAAKKSLTRRADGRVVDLTPPHLWETMVSVMDAVHEEDAVMDGMRLFNGRVAEIFFT